MRVILASRYDSLHRRIPLPGADPGILEGGGGGGRGPPKDGSLGIFKLTSKEKSLGGAYPPPLDPPLLYTLGRHADTSRQRRLVRR